MRRVFFSFHYANDVFRVDRVRTTWLASQPRFEDGSLWEKAATRDDTLLKRMIDRALEETSVTVILIGSETANRKYVAYEITQSLARGHGLLGVYIHQLPDATGHRATKGPNPLDKLTAPGTGAALSTHFDTFDWVDDDGQRNLGRWIEAAARKRLPSDGTSTALRRTSYSQPAFVIAD